MEPNQLELEYVGFWPRVGASIVDNLLVGIVIWPIVTLIYGSDYWLDASFTVFKGPWDFLLTWVFPAAAVILFWVAKQATPGKMLISARIVDSKTGEKPSTGQFIGSYFGYFVSMLPLFLGIIWVAFDRRKQGWHDKLAGTVVVRPIHRGKTPVVFDQAGPRK